MRTLLLLLAGLVAAGHADPPYSGTVWIDPDIVTPQDPTAYQSHAFSGRQMKTIYDRRPPGWIQVNAYVFEVRFDDGTTADFVVNPEFGSEAAAEAHVARYAPPIGQLSTTMRKDMHEVWINGGDAAAGGGNNSILLHTEYGERHLADGFLEEVLIHEAGHTSFDAEYARSEGWLAAQTADGEFISTYARDNPFREDISETLLPYFAVRHRADRISQADYDKITQAIPNRLAFLDSIPMDWHPMVTITATEPDLPAPAFSTSAFPNPTSGALAFHLNLTEPGHVQVVVYDLLGRRVGQLADGHLSAGSHALRWDGFSDNARAMRSGPYLIATTIDGAIHTTPVTLVR